ncbi:uncharacterized protein LOC144308782 isoform X4 [Canis aureus]
MPISVQHAARTSCCDPFPSCASPIQGISRDASENFKTFNNVLNTWGIKTKTKSNNVGGRGSGKEQRIGAKGKTKVTGQKGNPSKARRGEVAEKGQCQWYVTPGSTERSLHCRSICRS